MIQQTVALIGIFIFNPRKAPAEAMLQKTSNYENYYCKKWYEKI